jgi:hypothetical protein
MVSFSSDRFNRHDGGWSATFPSAIEAAGLARGGVDIGTVVRCDSDKTFAISIRCCDPVGFSSCCGLDRGRHQAAGPP